VVNLGVAFWATSVVVLGLLGASMRRMTCLLALLMCIAGAAEVTVAQEGAGVRVLDENGRPVDLWFIYKVPQLTKNSNSLSASGYEYMYYDARVGKLAQSAHKLTDGKGALNLTLDAVFKSPPKTTGWILYNDEMPASAKRKDKSSFGHTKGVIAFDTATKTAFWLLHSWPKYADPGATDEPTPIYGQTFLCLALDMSAASKIAAQMANHQEPQVYLPRVPETLDKSDPLYVLTQPLSPNPPADSNVLDIKTRGGLACKVIAKNRKWGKDFWNDLVGPTLGDDMNVETWIRGKIPPVLDSDGIHKTFDVKFIDLRKLGAQYTWPETHDHAKWGITKTHNWICVGDINRMVSQENRGGGTIAFQDQKLWQALSMTDLIVAPPGHNDAEARALIQSTHPKEPVDARPAKKAAQRIPKRVIGAKSTFLRP
jgi:deoxyribonuclease-2